MKKLNFVLILSLLFTNFALNAQYAYDDQVYDDSFYPGYLGDDFSLEGALEVFKNSRNIEAFEFDINNQDRYVNNLDLNNDGRIDFIRVSDQSESPAVRLIVMQAVLGRGDVQDVAVIAIEKTGRRTATLQIIGDEYLFGPDMIIEPNDIEYGNDRFGRGGPDGDIIGSRFFVNVYFWPSVRSLYRRNYRFYRSPYYWDYYPRVWNPWRPFGYSNYYNRCGIYRRGFYRVVPSVRIVYVTNFYRPRRVFSVRVRDRYQRNRPFYQNNRGGGRGSANNGNGNRGPRRSYSQTKPERRATYDAKRSVETVRTRDTRTSKSNASARTHKATTSQGNYRPTSDVKTSRSNSGRGYESTKSTRDTRTSKYDRPTRKTESTRDVRPARDSYSKKSESSSYKSSRKSETRSSSRPAPRSSASSRGSSSSKSSYSKPSRSSSSSASRGATSSSRRSSSASKGSSASRRSSSASSSSKKSSAAPRSSRSSSRASAPKAQRKSSGSSSKGRTKSRRGSAN